MYIRLPEITVQVIFLRFEIDRKKVFKKIWIPFEWHRRVMLHAGSKTGHPGFRRMIIKKFNKQTLQSPLTLVAQHTTIKRQNAKSPCRLFARRTKPVPRGKSFSSTKLSPSITFLAHQTRKHTNTPLQPRLDKRRIRAAN